jgi:enamine deaminase RidA (YjgF/YER057c/UK114 family)
MNRIGFAGVALGVIMTTAAADAQEGSFAPSRRAGRFIYVSGVRGSEAKGDVKAQTKRALENLDARLKSAGGSLASAAKVNVFLKNAADFAAMNEVYRGFWSQDPPARTTIVSASADPAALIEISAVGIPAGGERKVIHPADWAKSANPYSYGILSGDTLFLAGLVSRNGKDNSVVTGDVKTQTKTILDNGGEILKAAGMNHADVVQSRVYLTDTSVFQDFNASYRTFFPKDPPVRATVKSALMGPQYVIEITMVAVRGAREAFTTPNADGTPGTANPNLSSAVRAGDRLWLAGMLGNTPATKDDVAAQTKETLARLGRTLKAAGFGWEHVRESVVYVSDLKYRAGVEKEWAAQFPKDKPAGVLVEAPLVAPDGLVEIMLSAAK